MDMAILDSNGGGGSDVAGTTGGVPGVAGGAEGATSSISPVEGTSKAGALMSAARGKKRELVEQLEIRHGFLGRIVFQPAHACCLPWCLPYSAASACHGKDRGCNPHTVFPSSILSRARTHTGSATMAAKRLKELLETHKPSAHENSSITNGNETNGQSNEKSLQRRLGYELEVMVNMQNKNGFVVGVIDIHAWLLMVMVVVVVEKNI
ncbi:hypothetical protein VitviT2T_020001 [Vitis vinifera]|uniref:Uncharacterized protein n=1 Tax=Vitis vinifera TaxID=29760 RepID=A0ABY9D303_VITVI|nr:hypothetical protein VitviT2T_020001 [Vitis vinifera]